MVMSPRLVDMTALVSFFSLSGAMSWVFSLAMMSSFQKRPLVAGRATAVDLISCRLFLERAADQGAELRRQLLIELALEGHDQVGNLFQIGPAPGGEFRILGGDVDVAILAEEAEGIPFLALAAEPALPDLRHQLGRQIILQPILALADIAGAVGADLLAHLAPGGLQRLFLL